MRTDRKSRGDLDRTGTGPTTADRNFYHTQLHSMYSADSAGTYSFSALSSGVFSNNASGTFDNGTHGTYNVGFPDVLLATNGSVSAIQYVGGIGGTGAVQYPGTGNGGKVMTWGFPFETITSAPIRDAYMADVLNFFGAIPPPQFLPLVTTSGNSNVTLNWSTSSGMKYRVQYKTNLTDAVWQTLGADIVASDTVTSATDGGAGNSSQRFYRIAVIN